MSFRPTITYAFHKHDGLVISRVGSELAIPVLQFEQIGMGGHGFEPGDFRGPTVFKLEKFPIGPHGIEWDMYRWTRKIPRRLKNRHRRFWGLAPLKPIHRRPHETV